MNKGTKIRTVLRIIVSIYSAFCVHQVAIAQLGDMLGAPWLAVICAIIIVVLGLVVDGLTTYFNNDYTEAACIGTGVTRKIKEEEKGVSFSGVPAAELAELEYIDGGDNDE